MSVRQSTIDGKNERWNGQTSLDDFSSDNGESYSSD